jgi:hypothetical protein
MLGACHKALRHFAQIFFRDVTAHILPLTMSYEAFVTGYLLPTGILCVSSSRTWAGIVTLL